MRDRRRSREPGPRVNPRLGELDICRVGKTYPTADGGGVIALDDVSLHLTRGEFGVLLGPSGCGKSTLLRMVAGLETVSRGHITVSGRPASGPGRDRGMVFQSYTAFPWLTVEQNVAYGLRVNGSAGRLREGVVEHYLERIGLADFRGVYPDRLSGGMRQRVAIARVLANEPDVLLMDEPFGALDPETRSRMQELVLDVVRRERITVLMVTHDVEEALFMAHRIAFLSSHPGHLYDVIHPGFRSDGGIIDKQALRQRPDYRALEQRLNGMMRAAVGAQPPLAATIPGRRSPA